MKKLRIVAYVIGVSQLALGAIYLFAPAFFAEWQGLNAAPEDNNYALGMLAGRFLVYGVGMFVIARNPVPNRFWLDGMIAIQAVDLLVGLFYTATGVVTMEISAFPMFDAALFIGLLIWVRPAAQPNSNNA